MNDNELIIDVEDAGPRPQKPRKRADDRRVFVYRMIDGKPKEQGSFPETTIGAPLERRLPMFLREMFGTGEYKVETRKPNGHFERSFDFSINDDQAQLPSPQLIETEPAQAQTELTGTLLDTNGQMTPVEVENLLLKERLRRMEEDITRNKSGNHSEMQTLISALEESRREQRELMLMMLSKSQQPQQDATAQAMNILERSLGIVTKAKAISEEIAPNESSGGGGLLADGAKLIDSLGRNAGAFLPMIMGAGIGSRPAPPPSPRPTQPSNTPVQKTDTNGQLAELARQIKEKGEPKE